MYTKIKIYKKKTCCCTKLMLNVFAEKLKMQKYAVTFFFMMFVHLATLKNKENSYRYYFFDYDLVESNYPYFPSLLIQFV